MSKFTKLIKEKGILEKIQNTVDKVGAIHGDVVQEDVDVGVKRILESEIRHDEELEEAFTEYAYEVGLDAVVKELHITFNPDSDAARNISDHDRMIHSISGLLALLMTSSCR